MGDGSDRVDIRLAESGEDYRTFTSLVREYIRSLGFEVGWQDVDIEVAEAQYRYGKAGRGAALLVTTLSGGVVGIAAVRDLGDQVCELKRMYVRPPFRKTGIGKRLCDESISMAKRLGYCAIRLDTLDSLTAAKRLYEQRGFRRIPPYTVNPMPDALFYELSLDERR